MAITYEAANTTPFATASTTFSFTPDAGVQADDVFVVAVAHRQNSSVNVPANTLETPVNKAEITTGDRHVTVFVWRATSTSVTPVTFTLTASTVGNVAWARFRGVDVTDPVDVSSPGTYTYPTPNPAPSITTTVNNAFIVGGIACGSSSATPGVPSGSWVSRITTTVSTGLIATKGIQASAGATGAAAFTTDPTTINTSVWQLALRPAGAVTVPALVYNLTDTSTPTSISVKVKGTNATSARLKVGTNLAVTTGVVYGSSVTLDSDGYGDLTCTGLNPWTQYYYAVELTGSEVVTSAQVGKSKTLPTVGTPTSFTIGFGSCNEFYDETMTASLTAFSFLNRSDPDLFVHLGDISYEDNAASSQSSQRLGLEYNLNYSATFRSAFAGRQSVCVASDHDSGGNNAFPGAWSSAIRAARKQVLPVPDCPDPNGLYGSFVFGRVRMIFLDTRNFMASNFSTRLGSTQLAWLRDELNKPEPLKIIWTEQVWNDYSVPEGDDKWCNFPERTTIGNMIAAAPGTVIMAHGDSHMLAADDGTNNDWGGFPTVCAAAFYNYSSIKGDATWTQGHYPATDGVQVSQYGWFAITDSGDDITVQYNGYDSTNTSRVALTVTAEGTPSTPMSAYNFEGSGLSFADQTGGGRTVTLSSSSQRSSTAKNGTGSGALGTPIAGGSSGVSVAPYNATTSRSMTFWARESGAGVWLTRWQVSAADSGAFGVYYTGGTVRARFRKGSTNFNADSGVAHTAGTWVHYGITYNATTGVGRLYINGAQAATVTVTGGGTLDATDGIDLAADGVAIGAGTTNWLIDDLRIYDSEIPDFQVAVDMNTPVSSGAEHYEGSLSISGGGTLARTQTGMSVSRALGITAGGALGRTQAGMTTGGGLAFSGGGTQTTSPTPHLVGSLARSASGQLAFVATPNHRGSLDITGVGTLSVGSSSFVGTLSMSGNGTLSLSGRIAVAGSLSMAGEGTLSFSGRPSLSGGLNITGTGTLAEAGRPALSGALSMGGSGTLSLSSPVVGDASATGYVDGAERNINAVLRFEGVEYPITLTAYVDGEEYPLNFGIIPPPEGLAARWTFDDGVEDQIAGRALTLTSTTLVSARGGQALAAPTATGTADSEDGFLDLMGFSISYWLYTPTAASTTSITRVAFTAGATTVAELYSGWRNLAGGIYELSRLAITTDTGTLNTVYQNDLQTTVIPAQQWRHVAGVYDGAQMLLYINGVLVDSDPKTGTVTDPDAFTIRVQNTALVDDVEIWSRPLSATEIQAMYEEGL